MGLSRTNRDNTKDKKERVLKTGKIYEVKTFAAVNVFVKIIGHYPGSKSHYKGILLRSCDIENLRKAGVPYKQGEDPESCEGIVYPSQVIREIRNYEESRSKNTGNKRKKRRYSRPKT